jgi:hypothetical protein
MLQPLLDLDFVKIAISDAERLIEYLDRDEQAWDSRIIATVERVEHAIAYQRRQKDVR